MYVCILRPAERKFRDRHCDLLEILSALITSRLVMSTYTVKMLFSYDFSSWLLMKLNAISAGAMRKWYGPRKSTGTFSYSYSGMVSLPRWKIALSIMSTVRKRQFGSFLSRCRTSFMMKNEKVLLFELPQLTVNKNSPPLVSAPTRLMPRIFTALVTWFSLPRRTHPLLRWSVKWMTASSMLMIVIPACRAVMYFEAESYLCNLHLISLWMGMIGLIMR